MEDEGCGIVIIIIVILVGVICLISALFSAISLLYASFFRLLISLSIPVGLMVVIAALVGVAIGNYRTFKSVNRQTTGLLSSLGIVALAFILGSMLLQEARSQQKAAVQAVQYRQRIVGCWVGRFGSVTFAKIVISKDGSVLVKVPEGQVTEGQGQEPAWHEVLHGTLDQGSTSAALVSADDKPTKAFKATLSISGTNDLLTGNLSSANRSTADPITLERCLD